MCIRDRYLLVDRPMVRPVQGFGTQVFVGLTQIAITRNQDAVTVLQKRSRVHELAIAINNESRILGNDSGDTQARGELFGQYACANIDGQVATAGKRIESHIAEGLRKTAAGVIANQQGRRIGKGVEYLKRPRLAGRQ